LAADPAISIRSPNEVADFIRGLDRKGRGRLERIAKYYCFGKGLWWEDLLQESMLRVLRGTRVCPATLPIMTFLGQVLKGVSSDLRKAAARAPETKSADAMSAESDPRDFVELSDRDGNPEELLVAKQAAQKIREIFSDSDQAWDIIEAKLCGLSADEIQQMLDISATEYQSALRLIRRRLDKSASEIVQP
jgi:DNA-directed RNA polymerase specialized sigma24 family protein